MKLKILIIFNEKLVLERILFLKVIIPPLMNFNLFSNFLDLAYIILTVESCDPVAINSPLLETAIQFIDPNIVKLRFSIIKV